jgi:hypothetical protein
MNPAKTAPSSALAPAPPEWDSSFHSVLPQGGEATLDPEIRTPFHFVDLLRSLQSPSLIPTVFHPTIGGTRHEITKFLVLGKRAGGTPIRLSLFAGLEPGRIETVAAAVKLLTLLTISPVLAADYAVFGYPCVDPAGFATWDTGALAPLPRSERWEAFPDSADALLFRSELERVAPNGLLTLRSTGASEFVRASVNSRIIAREVVRPALLRMRHLCPVEDEPVLSVPADLANRQLRFGQGELLPRPDTKPWPFEIEIFAPGTLPVETRVQVLVLAALDILRTYRGFSCHGGEL